MRTTIYLPDELLAEAKKEAAATGRTLTAVIQDALQEALHRRSQVRKRARVDLPVLKGGKLQPGVDLDDSAALLDLMDSRDAAL